MQFPLWDLQNKDQPYEKEWLMQALGKKSTLNLKMWHRRERTQKMIESIKKQ
jgi:hypothetical protein